MQLRSIRKRLPDQHTVRQYPWLGWCAHWLEHHGLWAFHRRQVAGGVAIGLFAGLIPGPLQMLTAVLLCVLAKRNIPVAIVTTFYTNPLTIGPLYLLAYAYGKLLLGAGNHHRHIEPFLWDWSDWGGSFVGFWHWILSLGPPLAVGLAALALTLAALGYVFVLLAWRAYVVLAWRARARRRRASP
jgi:uncharacterized protein (DUF2062 family)